MLPYADNQAMTLHLAEIGLAAALGAHAVVLLDRPELNPQENVW